MGVTFLTSKSHIQTYQRHKNLKMTSDSLAQPLVSRTVWLGRSFWRLFYKTSPVVNQKRTVIMKALNEKFNFDFTTNELYKRRTINMKTSDISESIKKLDFEIPI